jgi:hypothetical protein
MSAKRDLIKEAMAEADNFMDVGRKLRARGVKYQFSTEPPMPPAYLVTIDGGTWFVVNEKHADDGSFTVNGLGLTR